MKPPLESYSKWRKGWNEHTNTKQRQAGAAMEAAMRPLFAATCLFNCLGAIMLVVHDGKITASSTILALGACFAMAAFIREGERQ
jgi:hypothetical protein